MKPILILFLLATLTGCYSKDPEQTGLEGKPLPAFVLLLADSITHFDTGNIPVGKPVVLFFFSPECPYCLAQVDDIIENIQPLKDIQFYIFTDRPFAEMQRFYSHYQLNKYPNIKVGTDYSHFFAGYFKVKAVPYLAIYGKEKRLNKAFMGKIYSKQIKEVAED